MISPIRQAATPVLVSGGGSTADISLPSLPAVGSQILLGVYGAPNDSAPFDPGAVDNQGNPAFLLANFSIETSFVASYTVLFEGRVLTSPSGTYTVTFTFPVSSGNNAILVLYELSSRARLAQGPANAFWVAPSDGGLMQMSEAPTEDRWEIALLSNEFASGTWSPVDTPTGWTLAQSRATGSPYGLVATRTVPNGGAAASLTWTNLNQGATGQVNPNSCLTSIRIPTTLLRLVGP